MFHVCSTRRLRRRRNTLQTWVISLWRNTGSQAESAGSIPVTRSTKSPRKSAAWTTKVPRKSGGLSFRGGHAASAPLIMARSRRHSCSSRASSAGRCMTTKGSRGLRRVWGHSPRAREESRSNVTQREPKAARHEYRTAGCRRIQFLSRRPRMPDVLASAGPRDCHGG